MLIDIKVLRARRNEKDLSTCPAKNQAGGGTS